MFGVHNAPAPRRFAAWLATGALLTLAAAPLAVARGPAGGYHEPYNGDGGRWNGPGDGWSAALTPLRWLRQSSRGFQSLMGLLAERSVEHRDSGAAMPPPPKRYPEEPHLGDEGWPQSRDGGEAKAGHDRTTSGVRVKDWRRWFTSCRRAGVQVRRGSWYVVQRGDTLWGIAEVHYGYGGTYRRILRANWPSIPDPGLIFPCQRLYIPHWRGSRHEAEEAGGEPAHGLAGLGPGSRTPRSQGSASGGSEAENGWP